MIIKDSNIDLINENEMALLDNILNTLNGATYSSAMTILNAAKEKICLLSVFRN